MLERADQPEKPRHHSHTLGSAGWQMAHPEDVALDWNLDASGTLDSFFQKPDSHAYSKSYGHWVLSGNRIILSINQKLEKDIIGQQTCKRASEEKRIRVLKAAETELQILFDGKTVSLHRS